MNSGFIAEKTHNFVSLSLQTVKMSILVPNTALVQNYLSPPMLLAHISNLNSCIAHKIVIFMSNIRYGNSNWKHQPIQLYVSYMSIRIFIMIKPFNSDIFRYRALLMYSFPKSPPSQCFLCS